MNLPKAVWVPGLVLCSGMLIWAAWPRYSGCTASAQSSAASALKSGVFPAEYMFQRELILDQDGDGVGEYGLLSEVSGRRKVGSHEIGNIKLLQLPFTKDWTANGYCFAIYLPDGRGGSISDPAELGPRLPGAAQAIKDQERRFVAYAWPTDRNVGQRMFAITESGLVRSVAWDGQRPAWNAVFGGLGWEVFPTWSVDGR